MGIDYGKKRVGIALSDEGGEFALPHSVFVNSARLEELVEKVAKLCVEQKVGAIVMGESKDFHQVANPIMKDAMKFKAAIEEATKISVYLEPEFMTSAEAEHLQGKNKMLDASAAALILKSFLESHRDEIKLKKE